MICIKVGNLKYLQNQNACFKFIYLFFWAFHIQFFFFIHLFTYSFINFPLELLNNLIWLNKIY